MFANILVLVGLLKLLSVTEKPILCSSVYSIVVLISGLFFGIPMQTLIINVVIAFVLSTIYFALLNRFSESGLYWLILVGGLFIGLI